MLAVAGFMVFPSFAAPTFRAQVTASGYKGSTPLADFPALMRISPSTISGFSYSACAANGSDISFALADGTVLPHEIDTWNPDGESLAWVKLPSLSGTDTSFYIRWCDANPPQNAPTSVWDANYISVWHMGEINAEGAVPDATGNGYNAATSSVAVVSTSPCKVGAAMKIVSGRLEVADYESEFTTAGTVFSGSGWFILPGKSAGYMSIVNKKTTNGDAWSSNNGWYWEMNNSLTSIGFIGKGNNKQTVNLPNVAQNWNHYTFTSSGSQINLYINGSLLKTYSHALAAGGKLMTLLPVAGGVADEMRMRNAVSSPDWVKAEYDSVANASFLTYGAAEVLSSDYIIVSANDRQYGAVSPSYGVNTSPVDGQTYTFACTTSEEFLDGTETTKAVCTGWKLYAAATGTLLRSSADEGESATSFTHTYAAGTALEVIWQWKIQYLVTATANAGGSVSPASQWVDANRNATIVATPDSTHAFYKWTNDVPASVSATSDTISFPVSGPMSLFATFGDVLYVATDGNDDNDGTTPSTALATVEAAMAKASNGVIVRVLAGEFPLSQTLALTDEVAVEGAGRDLTTLRAPANGAFTAIKVANANAKLTGITLTGVNFSSTPSTAASGGTYDSGGNYKAPLGIQLSAGTVSHCAVSNNTCCLRTPQGFVVMSGGTLDDVIVACNKVTHSYGYCSGYGVNMSGGTMTNCVVTGNTHSGQVYGLIYMSGSAKIFDCDIFGNDGGGSGYDAGVYSSSANNVIDHCRIHGNSPNALFLKGTARDSLIYCNTNAGTTYAGVSLADSTAKLYNCTIWGNVTKGATDGRSGLLQTTGTAVNNIIWGNGPAGSTFGSTAVSGGTFNTNIVDVATSLGVGVIVADPKFADAAAFDFSLTLSSPAVNAGAPIAGAVRDFAGTPRDAAIDIGAYEFSAPAGLGCAIVLSQAQFAAGSSPTARAAVTGAANPGFAWYVDGVLTDQTSATASFAGLAPGRHSIRLVVTDGEATVEDEVADAIAVLPTVTYASTTGSNTFPYDTEAKAARSPNDAFNATWCDSSTTGTVHIAAGTYALSTTLLLTQPVRVLGAGSGSTILTAGGTSARVLNVGHKGAVVRGLTATGCTNIVEGSGVYMSGGWMEDVRITRNRQYVVARSTTLAGGAGLRLSGGTVTNCVIDANHGQNNYGSTPAVGVRMSGGLITDSVICSNSSNHAQQNGLGINISGGTIRRCRIFRNSSSSVGTQAVGQGIYMSAGTVEYCHIYSNGINGVCNKGGTLRNCAVYGHTSSINLFSGVQNAGGTVQNCTIFGNQSTVATAGIHGLQQSSGTTVNSIIWGNGPVGNSVGSCSVTSGTTFKTNVVDLAVSAGVDCIVGDPLFENAEAYDFHLRFGSPAIDRGAPLAAVRVDLDGLPRPQNDAWDIGAYEYVPGNDVICSIVQEQAVYPDGGTFAATATVAGADTNGMTYTWSLAHPGGATQTTTTSTPTFAYANAAVGIYTLSLTVETAGGATYAATDPVTFEAKPFVSYVSNSGSATYPYDAPEKATPSPNDAFLAIWRSAGTTGTIHVAEGNYALSDGISVTTPVRILGAGRDATVINGAASTGKSGFTVASSGARLEGFTLTGCTNGVAGSGISLSSGTLSGLRVAHNQTKITAASTLIPGGGGIRMYGGTVTNCIVHGNTFHNSYGFAYGTGIHMSGGLVVDSAITGNYRINWSQSGGNGVYMSGGRLLRCRIQDNHCQGKSSSVAGCGIYADGSVATIENCAIVSNSTHGVFLKSGKMVNTLVTGHVNSTIKFSDNDSAIRNAGVYSSGARILNCTIWGNVSGGDDYADLYHATTSGSVVNTIAGSATVSATTASCNILNADPGFKAPARGDFHLRGTSAAIDAGDNAPWSEIADATDLDGDRRIVHRIVDIGCFEYGGKTATLILMR
jgi:hypothetical protein